MSKALRYGSANAVALVILAVAYDSEVPLWQFLVAATVGLTLVNLLVACIGPKGDARKV